MNIKAVPKLLYWLIIVLISILALLPGTHLQTPILDWWDKAQHFVAFGVLALLGVRVYSASRFAVLGCLLVYGVAIELAQDLSGWRSGDRQDVVADAVGLLAAWCVIRWRDERRPKNLTAKEL